MNRVRWILINLFSIHSTNWVVFALSQYWASCWGYNNELCRLPALEELKVCWKGVSKVHSGTTCLQSLAQKGTQLARWGLQVLPQCVRMSHGCPSQKDAALLKLPHWGSQLQKPCVWGATSVSTVLKTVGEPQFTDNSTTHTCLCWVKNNYRDIWHHP